MRKDVKVLNEGTNLAGANGNVFQVEAAIYLYLENINNCKYISVEDADDIRITLKDSNEEIIAQAKSSLDSKISANHSSDIYNSFASFSRCKNSGVVAIEYCCVFNYTNPFGDSNFTFNNYKANSQAFSFEELPENIKVNLVNEYNSKSYTFGIEKTVYRYIWYADDKHTDKKAVMKNKIKNFIEKTGIDNVNNTTLYSRLFSILSHNQSEKYARVPGDVLLGVIFDESSKSKGKMFDVFDSLLNSTINVDSKALKDEYNSLFGKSIRFEFFSEVNSFYFNYLKNNPRLDTNDSYLNLSKEFYETYKESENFSNFIIESNENIELKKELLIRMATIHAVIHYDEINRIEKAINYEN